MAVLEMMRQTSFRYRDSYGGGQMRIAATEQGGGLWVENYLEKIKGKGYSGSVNLTGFLLKTG